MLIITREMLERAVCKALGRTYEIDKFLSQHTMEDLAKNHGDFIRDLAKQGREWQIFSRFCNFTRNSSPENRRGINLILAELPERGLVQAKLAKYIDKKGRICLFRGTDTAEANNARKGKVDDLGYYWTPVSWKAAGFASMHGKQGCLLAICIPARYCKRVQEYKNGPETSFSAPEVWPHLHKFYIVRNSPFSKLLFRLLWPGNPLRAPGIKKEDL